MKKILLLRWGEEIIMDSLQRAFKDAGCEARILDLNESSSVEEAKKAVEAFSPHFCLTHNMSLFQFWLERGFEFEDFIVQKNIPMAVWLFDSPVASGPAHGTDRFLFGKFPSQFLFFCVDRVHIEILKFRRLQAEYLPIAVDQAYGDFRPSENLRAQFSCDLSVVSKPFVSFEYFAEREELINDFSYRSCSEFARNLSHFVRAGLVRGISEKDALESKEILLPLVPYFQAMYSRVCSSAESYNAAIDEFRIGLESRLPPSASRAIANYLGRMDFLYSYLQLILYLRELQPLGLRVYGGEAWGKFCLRNYSQPTPRLSQDELLSLFACSKINFCHTKWQFRDAVHERPFLIYAVGGFPLTDYRSGLETCFEKDEIVSYRSLEEAKDLIRYYLSHDAERLKVIQKGRDRVLRDHTYHPRAEVILKRMHQYFGV